MTWKFRTGGDTESPQNAGIKEFSKHIFESIVREAVQNSLDNPLTRNSETKTPVIVEFNFKTILKNNIPKYDELISHIKASHEYWSEESYRSLMDSMINRINEFGNEIPYLEISDYNTTGMNLEHESNIIRKTSYFAFTRGNNTVKQNSNSGGSEGQGKSTFYAASALRTIFLHSISEFGSLFEGLTRLATHQLNNQDLGANGHIFQNLDNPNYEQNDEFSHLPFRRINNSTGTTVSIIGLWNDNINKEKMIKAAINNFWMAISSKDLIIRIDGVEINSENIEALIERYLPERSESNKTKSNPTEYGRTKCYYETWEEKFELTNAQETFTDTLPTLGECILKIASHHEYPGKIAFFRKQKMLITRSTNFIKKGYCGVFICNGSEGNRILRKMEGKTHTEWDPSFYTENVELGKRAIKELNEFIIKSWEEYRKKHFPETIELKGIRGAGSGQRGVATKQDKKEKNPKRKKPTPRVPRDEFTKTGIIKNGLSSVQMPNGLWTYSLKLKANKNKNINLEILPATDAARVKKTDALRIISASEDWEINENCINGSLLRGVETTVVFTIDAFERIGINFNITVIN